MLNVHSSIKYQYYKAAFTVTTPITFEYLCAFCQNITEKFSVAGSVETR